MFFIVYSEVLGPGEFNRQWLESPYTGHLKSSLRVPVAHTSSMGFIHACALVLIAVSQERYGRGSSKPNSKQ